MYTYAPQQHAQTVHNTRYPDPNLTMHKNRCLYYFILQTNGTAALFIGHTNLNKGELATTGRLDRIKLHLERKTSSGRSWQHFQPPITHRCEEAQKTNNLGEVSKRQENRLFYSSNKNLATFL